MTKETPTIEELVSRVPEDATWHTLAPDLRTAFEKRASALLTQDRQAVITHGHRWL
jgi:hypothetical protein